jgi:hypothetical protein
MAGAPDGMESRTPFHTGSAAIVRTTRRYSRSEAQVNNSNPKARERRSRYIELRDDGETRDAAFEVVFPGGDLSTKYTYERWYQAGLVTGGGKGNG